MENVATNIPGPDELLCETCGYRLGGLPNGANCPECGHNTAESAPSNRHLTDWERNPGPRTFFSTSIEILLHPSRFYRSLLTRKSRHESSRFAVIQWIMASVFFGIGEYVHIKEYFYFDLPAFNSLIAMPIVATQICSATIVLLFFVTTPLAAWLTSWEGRYRGLRLPLTVVRRGLDYHAAHYLPVAIVSAVTIVGYRWLINHRYVDSSFDAKYLYILCGEVIVGAAYLFNTYWIGMRNMMYANA